jgi:hypothetical protein
MLPLKTLSGQVNGLATIKSMLSQFNTSLQQAKHHLEDGSPLPYEQNDDLSDGSASVGDSGARPKKRGRGKNYNDELIEITPEMYGLAGAEEPGKKRNLPNSEGGKTQKCIVPKDSVNQFKMGKKWFK